MQCGTITLTASTVNTDNFSLYSNVDGYTTPFETGISRASLLAPGYYTELIPDGATTLRITSDSVCTNYVDVPIQPLPTPTPTVTPTPTPTPTPMPTILTSMGSTTVTTSTPDEYDAYRRVNHTPHSPSQVITMTFNYDLVCDGTADYADVTIYYRKNTGGWVSQGSLSATGTYQSTSGSFSVTLVDYNDTVDVRALHYVGNSAGDQTYVTISTTGGTVTSGYGPVGTTGTTSWDTFLN